ncbi:MAG: DUF3990 domain-containing protein [Bacilli bacterium]|nr:DUF3990 domain-containing protein [Bacilli bacterium]
MGKLLFHGTIYDFSVPDLNYCKDKKDFGKGFYLAEDLNHAKSIANKSFLISRYAEYKYIYSYRIDVSELRESNLNVHEFREANIAWLDYIMKNRMKINDDDDYDVVIGPTADAEAQCLVMKFYHEHGLNATNNQKASFIQKLKPCIYGRQYCFKTDKSLEYLNNHFVERRTI